MACAGVLSGKIDLPLHGSKPDPNFIRRRMIGSPHAHLEQYGCLQRESLLAAAQEREIVGRARPWHRLEKRSRLTLLLQAPFKILL